jgi:NADPH2:quinone reductase
VRVYGDIVTILEPSGSLKIARDRNLRISLELMLTPALMGLLEAQKYQTQILREGARLIEENKLTIHLSQTFPLAEVISAHKLLETGSVTGKVALIID